jgi:hypothetical protein
MRLLVIGMAAALATTSIFAPGAQAAPQRPADLSSTTSTVPAPPGGSKTAKTPSTKKASAPKTPYINQLYSIPVFTASNPAAGALDQFEQFDASSAFGLMLAVATISLWGYWAGGMLLSGSGGTEAVESVVKMVLAAIGITMWPTLFRDGIAAANGLCNLMLTAPFAHAAYTKFAARLGSELAVSVSGATGLAALGATVGKGLGLGAAGLSVASFVSTGDPIAWFIDFVVVLGLMVGELIIQIERLGLFAATAFIYVTGPLAIGLTAFRGLNPLTSAFFRVAQAVPAISVVWAIFLLLFAILDTSTASILSAPGVWWANIGNNVTALVLLWLLVLTPGMVRRHVGAGGAGAAGMFRTAAMIGGYRLFRGGSGRNPNRGAARRAFGRARGAGERPVPAGGAGARPVPAGGAGARPVPAGGAGARPVPAGGAGARPSNNGGAGPRPSNGGGAGPRPSKGGGAGGRPVAAGGAGARPSNTGGAGPRPTRSGGASARPSSNGGAGARPAQAAGAGERASEGGGAGARPTGSGGAGGRPANNGGPAPRPTGGGTGPRPAGKPPAATPAPAATPPPAATPVPKPPLKPRPPGRGGSGQSSGGTP